MRSVYALRVTVRAAIGVLALATAAAAATPIQLEAHFNDKPIDAAIGTGGPTLGEPISVGSLLSAVVVASPMATPALRLRQTSPGFARGAIFEFLDSEEITSGELWITLTVRTTARDNFFVYVREQGGAARSFANITFGYNGAIAVAGSGSPSQNFAAYEAGADQRLALRFNMDTATYDVYLNDSLEVANRFHGITARGIGRVIVAVDTNTASDWFVDDVRVFRDTLFRNGFDG